VRSGGSGGPKPARAGKVGTYVNTSTGPRWSNSTLRRVFTKGDARAAVLYLAPALMILAGVIGYPLLKTLWTSLHYDVPIYPHKGTPFVGLENYRLLLGDSSFITVLENTLVYVTFAVLLKVLFGLSGALLLNCPYRGRNFFRAIVLLPWVIPTVASGVVWRWIFNSEYGVLNGTLKQLGLLSHSISWLGNPLLAMMAVVWVDAWKGIPFMIVVLLAGLQAIPHELYEAADVDGAIGWKRLVYITIPQIKPVLVTSTTLSVIWTITLAFNVVWVLTGGGPVTATEVLSTNVYRVAFQKYDFCKR